MNSNAVAYPPGPLDRDLAQLSIAVVGSKVGGEGRVWGGEAVGLARDLVGEDSELRRFRITGSCGQVNYRKET